MTESIAGRVLSRFGRGLSWPGAKLDISHTAVGSGFRAWRQSCCLRSPAPDCSALQWHGIAQQGKGPTMTSRSPRDLHSPRFTFLFTFVHGFT